MVMVFEKEYALRGSDFDCYDRLRPASVLDLFQDVAGIHAIRLGVGFDDLIAREMIWVLTKVKYEVVGAVRRYDRVRVRTWPLPPSRVNFRREYCIEELDGTPLVHGTSEWVVVHSEKRRVLPAGNVYPDEEYCLQQLFEGRLRKIPAAPAEGAGYGVTPTFTHLDINGHVNNTKYADYVLDALQLPRDKAVRAFQIDYHRELLLGTPVQLHWQWQEDTALVCGRNAEGENMFCCSVVCE